nr:T9SS type A sorting domain-containing protein [Bacteroidota bacterium]
FSIQHSIFFFLLFLLLFPPSLPAQEWTEPVNITNLGGYSMTPDMVIDHKGIIHVVWSYRIEDNFWKIMYTSSADFGETWTAPLDLLQNTDLWMSSPHIDCDSKNNLYVTYTYNTINIPEMLIKMLIYDGHEWSESILVSESMPGSDFSKVVVDNDDRVFVFWAYGSQFMYYRYLENEAWSDFYCPYCDSVDIFGFTDGHFLSGNFLHWIGYSASFNYHGERLQYYLFDIRNNSWSTPQMPVPDTIQVGVDITLDNDGVPVCVYRNKPSGDDRTKFIQKDGNNWSNPEMVACVNGSQKYQQIAVDQNNDVHIVESEIGDYGTRLFHYKKLNNFWYGQIIDSAWNMCHFTKMLFYTNNLFVVYHKSETPTSVGDLWFSKYYIITNIKEKDTNQVGLKIYPNPTTNTIYIEFKNDKQQFVDLSVFDIIGKYVITLINNENPCGKQRVLWNGTDKNGKEVKSGPYLVRLKSGRKTVSQIVEIIK